MDNAKIIHFNKDGTYLTLDEERSGVRLYMHLKGIEFIPVWFASFKDCAKTTRDFINSMEAKNG
jgi:hypothetical protein